MGIIKIKEQGWKASIWWKAIVVAVSDKFHIEKIGYALGKISIITCQ